MKVATVWMPPPTPWASSPVSQSGEPMALSASAKPSTKIAPASWSKEIDEGPAHPDREEEHQVHRHKEDGDSQGAVEHDAVDPLGEVGRGLAGNVHGVMHDVVGEAIAGVCHEDVEFAAETLGKGLGAPGEGVRLRSRARARRPRAAARRASAGTSLSARRSVRARARVRRAPFPLPPHRERRAAGGR